MAAVKAEFTEKDFCLGLEKLYWSYKWNSWKWIKFQIRWLLGHYRDKPPS